MCKLDEMVAEEVSLQKGALMDVLADTETGTTDSYAVNGEYSRFAIPEHWVDTSQLATGLNLKEMYQDPCFAVFLLNSILTFITKVHIETFGKPPRFAEIYCIFKLGKKFYSKHEANVEKVPRSLQCRAQMFEARCLSSMYLN